jgi:hypothetical protein
MAALKWSTPSSFFSIPVLKPGSKSLASFTLETGLTRNGSMNRAIHFEMSSAMDEASAERTNRESAATLISCAQATRLPVPITEPDDTGRDEQHDDGQSHADAEDGVDPRPI